MIFKGGCLVTLAKKAHASLHCSDFRSILLSSVPGKLLHRSLRRRLLPLLSNVSLPLQAGATPGASPELLTLYLMAFQRWAQATCGRWAVAFFDIKQAYYRTLRQLVVDCDSDAGVLKVLYDLGLSAAALCELRSMLQRAADTSPLAGRQHLCALLRDSLSATWFKFDGSQLLTVTHKGTRPGDPAADVLFAFTLATLFQAINSCLDAHGLVDAVPHVQCAPLVNGFAEATHLQFVSWADDFARPFLGDTPLDLISRVKLATKCCTERATACGIELTFGKDKTAAVCDDATVRALQDQGFHVLADGLSFVDEVAGRTCVLPFVSAYKHLGGIFSASGKPDLEVFLRRAAALGQIRPVRAKLFANSSVPLATRRTLLYSLGLSRFVHGSGALHLTQKGHQRHWPGAYVSIWAHLFTNKPNAKPHSYQVLAVSKAPPPHLFLALQRAALLARLVRGNLTSVLHMLQLEWEAGPALSWLGQVLCDIRTVAEWVTAARTLSQCGSPLHELCEQVEASSAWWMLIVRSAIKAFAADVLLWKQKPAVVTVPDGGAFKCNLCGDTFAQRSFLAIHQARRHQLFAPARHFAPDRQCVSCLRTFATVMLTQAHLRRNPSCLARVARLIPPLGFEEICAAERCDKQTLRTVRRGGWQNFSVSARFAQAQGPLNITFEDVDCAPEDFATHVSARVFRPSYGVLDWIDGFIAGSTSSGPRQTTTCWWHVRPSRQNS